MHCAPGSWPGRWRAGRGAATSPGPVPGATISSMPASSIVARRTVTPGIDRLLTVDRRLIAGRRVGLVCNPASVDATLTHTADRLHEDPDITLAALFGPQHGFRSDVQDNMIETPHVEDCRRRVPVFSLYSDTREPTPDMLEGLDVLVINLQDVGTRVYTYIYTMANCMRAAARRGLPVVVCDRPNPIGGEDVEGACLDESVELVCRSVSDPDAPRHDDWRARAPVQRRVRHRRPPRGRHARRVAAIDVLRRDGSSLDHPVAEHPDARQRYRLSRRRPHRRHEAVGGPRHDAAIRAHRGAVDRRRAAGGGDERRADCQASTSGRCSSSRRSRSMPASRAVAVRSTSSIDVRFSRCALPWSSSTSSAAKIRRGLRGESPLTSTEHDKEPIDILYGSDRLRRALNDGGSVAALVESWRADEERFRRQREPHLLYQLRQRYTRPWSFRRQAKRRVTPGSPSNPASKLRIR